MAKRKSVSTVAIQWHGVREFKQKMTAKEKAIADIPYQVLSQFAPQIESQAKEDAVWTDRTGNARQSLWSRAYRTKTGAVLYLVHGMAYGVHLELKYQGRYAIIMRTLDIYTPRIRDMLRGIMR